MKAWKEVLESKGRKKSQKVSSRAFNRNLWERVKRHRLQKILKAKFIVMRMDRTRRGRIRRRKI